jgi:hypothetical protein
MKSRFFCSGLAVVAVLAIAACGSSSKSTAGSGSSTTGSSTPHASKSKNAATNPKMTAQEVATKLAPLGCVPTPSSPSTASVGQTPPVAAVDCTVSGQSITISEYQNKKQLASNVQAAQGPGCAVARANGATVALLVTGRNWAVHWPKTTATAQAIDNAIGNGAKTVSIQC